MIASVVEGGPADQAGLVRGDVLLQVNDETIPGFAELMGVLEDYEPGDEVQVTVLHGDDQRTLTVTLGARERLAYLGIVPCMDLFRPEVAATVYTEGPVAVVHVVPDSPADEAGLQEGDVIVAVDGRKLSPERSLAAAIASHEPGDAVTLEVKQREDEEQKSVPSLAPVSLVAACPAPADLAAASAARQVKKGDDEMRNQVWVLVVLLVLSLVAGCSRIGSTPACPPVSGEGTISPAVSIYSIVFVVNGVEQVVRDGDALQASPGEEVQVREVTICVGSFSGNGGEACVDFAPVDPSGQEIVSEHRGTHTVWVTPGFTSISGPDRGWIIGENWRHIAVVLNHWPPDGTEDLGCGGGRCERDDRTIVGFR